MSQNFSEGIKGFLEIIHLQLNSWNRLVLGLGLGLEMGLGLGLV